MRIGIVTEDDQPSAGGVGEQARGFAREARRLGHSVKILTGRPTELPRLEDGPEVIRLGPSRPLLSAGSLRRMSTGLGASAEMREALARERFDVVHVHCPLTPVLPLLAIHHATGPVVGTFHGRARCGAGWRLARRVLQRYLDRLDAAVAVSRACLEPLRAGRLRADFAIIPPGVDVDRFGRGRRLRRFDDGRVNVLFAGRAEPDGGLDRMLSAFLLLRSQVDCRLLVMTDGPLLDRYRARVPEEAREDVVFGGEVGDARPDWYASADVVCVPGQGAAVSWVLEAMAAARPVVASDVESHRELLRHGREGELVDPGDDRAWVRAVLRATRDPARGAALGERGRVAVQRYAWPAVAREVLALYRAIGVRG